MQCKNCQRYIKKWCDRKQDSPDPDLERDCDQFVDRSAVIADFLGEDYDLDRLRELVEADKAGRCFVSDVKLGGEVFYIPKFNGKPYCGIREGHVQAVSFTKAGKRIKIREYHAHNQDFMLGKTVFLTPESAEVALKGEQHECN